MSYRLVVSTVAARTSSHTHAFELDREVILVGRRSGVDVPLPHPDVGGVHFRLEKEGDGIVLINGGFESGTVVNGEPVPVRGRRPLADGDEIVVANAFRLRFEANAEGGQVSAEETGDLARAMVRDVLASLAEEAPDATPTLEVISGPAAGRTFALPVPGKEVVIGRGETCDLALLDPDLSREHARVRRDWSGALVSDLGSKNGTTVGKDRLVPGVARRLRDGDILEMGGTKIRYKDPAEAYLSSLTLAASQEADADFVGKPSSEGKALPADPEWAKPPDPAPAPEPAAAPTVDAPGFPWLTVLFATLLVATAAAALVFLLTS